MQTSFWKITITTILLVSALFFAGCEKETESDNGNSSSLSGIWVRTLGASGDETDIAIGDISGEPSNRVYMCEWKGAVGLYKGYISGSTITWDSQYGLPNASVRKVGSQLEFYYPSVSGSLPTYYNAGSWSNRCGELKYTPKNIYYRWTTSSTCSFPSGYTLTYNYPDLPSSLTKSQLYGPIAPGLIRMKMSGNDYSNNLSGPAPGYSKRTYTHIIYAYDNTLNRCVFQLNSDINSILTYVDEQ